MSESAEVDPQPMSPDAAGGSHAGVETPASGTDASRAGLVSALELLSATATRLKRIEYAVGHITDDGLRAALATTEERRQMSERIDALEARIVDLERINRKTVAMLRYSNDRYVALAERVDQLDLSPVEPMPAAAPAPQVQDEPEPTRGASLMGKVADMLAAQPKRRG